MMADKPVAQTDELLLRSWRAVDYDSRPNIASAGVPLSFRQPLGLRSGDALPFIGTDRIKTGSGRLDVIAAEVLQSIRGNC
jgi:hypothetical protein